MTPEELRKIDAEIAEKVMGLTVQNGIEIWHGPDLSRSPLPHYSTDIAAAWEVVEKLSKEYDFRMHTRAGYSGIWAAFGHNPLHHDEMMEGDFPYGAFESSAPLAICKAALKALQPK